VIALKGFNLVAADFKPVGVLPVKSSFCVKLYTVPLKMLVPPFVVALIPPPVKLPIEASNGETIT